MFLDDIIIVLARPSEPGNAGAVCRAMKNMGLSRLRIAAAAFPAASNDFAGPGGEKAIDLERLLARAIHARDIWENAEHFGTLEEALEDCTVTIGTSRRRGRHRKANTLNPGELAGFLREKPGKAAIVFGNERTGLNREELELCNIASHIPVSPEFPSINLSHAVQIYAYEFYQAFAGSAVFPGAAPVPGQWVPMDAAEIDTLVKKISNSLEALGFYKYPGREEQERFLRDLIARAGLGLKEGRYFGNIIAKAGRLGNRQEK